MFWKWLRQQLDERGWSPAKLAEEAGLERTHVYKLISPEYGQTPRRSTVMRIAQALGVPVSEAMRAAGYVASANLVYDTNDLLAETASVLREVLETRYQEALRFLRKQLDFARETFAVEDTSTTV